jgi:hypothetical protein
MQIISSLSLTDVLSYIYVRLHVDYLILLSDFNETWIFSTNCRKYWNVKLHENLSSGSRVSPRGRTDGQWDTTKLIVVFRNFVDVTKNHEFTRPGACMGYVAHCEVFLNKVESVSDFFHVWYRTNHALIARWWVTGPLTCCISWLRNATQRTLILLGLQWSIYCDVIEFSFFVCDVEDNLPTWRPSTCRVYQIPET